MYSERPRVPGQHDLSTGDRGSSWGPPGPPAAATEGGLEARGEEKPCELWDPGRGVRALHREASAVPRNTGREVGVITHHMKPR